MASRSRGFLGLPLLFALFGLGVSGSAYANVTTVTDSTSLRLALSAAATGDTVLVVGDGIQQAIARLASGIHLICETPYANSLRHLEAVDLQGKALVEGFLFRGAWPPDLDPPPRGTIDASVLVSGSKISFQQCRFEELYYSIPFPSYFKTGAEPPSQVVPIAVSNSSATFSDCRFESNGGNVELSEGPAFGCVGQWGSGWLFFENCSFENQAFPISAEGPLGIIATTFRNCGPGFIQAKGGFHLSTSLVVGCGPSYYQYDDLVPTWGYATGIVAHGQIWIEENTFVDNPMVWRNWGIVYELENPDIYVPLIALGESATGVVSHNLFIGMTGAALEAPATITVACNDAWDSESALWTGGIGDVTGVDGNISQAPIFCSRVDSIYTLSVQSPAATAACGLMGAFPVDCDRDTPVAIENFQAKWTPEGVALQWRLAGSMAAWTARPGRAPRPASDASSPGTSEKSPPAVSPVVFIERLDHTGLHEIYRGTATQFIDLSPSPEKPLRYALGYEADGQELSALAWATPSGESTLPHTRLLGASPNPFNPRTEIRFELALPADARLEIFDSMGRRVRSWQMPALAAGPHAVGWHGLDDRENKVASGVYHMRLEVEGKIFSDRLVLLR